MLSAHHVFFCFLSTVTLLTWACPVGGVWTLAPWAPVHITDTSSEHALQGEFERLPHGHQFVSLTHHLSMPCMGSLNACPMGASSYHWHSKPTEEETLVSIAVQLLNRAWPAVWTIQYGLTWVAVQLMLRGVFRSSNVQVCLVDISGVCM